MSEIIDIAFKALAFVFFLILWGGMFFGIFYLVGTTLTRKSGWDRLQKIFRFDESYSGKLKGFQSSSVNGVGYSSALSVGIDDFGIYLKPLMIMRPFQKPVYIPWEELEIKNEKSMMVFTKRRIRISSVPDFYIEFPGYLMKEVIAGKQKSQPVAVHNSMGCAHSM